MVSDPKHRTKLTQPVRNVDTSTRVTYDNENASTNHQFNLALYLAKSRRRFVGDIRSARDISSIRA